MAIFNPLNSLPKQSEKQPVPGKVEPVAFNPLISLSETEVFKSESGIQNMAVGECAKCKSPMSEAVLTDGSPMYFCEKCRVVSPMPDTAAVQ